MNYYYISLIIYSIFYLFLLYEILNFLTSLKRKKSNKKFWLSIIVLIPLMFYCIKTFLFYPYMDLKFAITGKTKTIEGCVDKVYVSGVWFLFNGEEFRRNPWSFKPKENDKYVLTYLPNSKYVVSYKLIN